MNFIFGVMFGIVLSVCLAVTLSTPMVWHENIQECEKDIKRSQHCKLVAIVDGDTK